MKSIHPLNNWLIKTEVNNEQHNNSNDISYDSYDDENDEVMSLDNETSLLDSSLYNIEKIKDDNKMKHTQSHAHAYAAEAATPKSVSSGRDSTTSNSDIYVMNMDTTVFEMQDENLSPYEINGHDQIEQLKYA